MKTPHKLILLLMVAFTVTGCAVTPEKISATSSSQPMEVLLCGDALQQTLGIAPIIDNRPEFEKTGQKPKGVFLGVWNQRIGNYVTSDKDFGGDASKTVTQEITKAIEKSNCFFEVKGIEEQLYSQPSAEDLLVVFAKTKIRYVLVVELEHFYGTQHQHSHLAVVPALYVNAASVANSVGAAEGVTELNFSIHDTQTGQEIWRDKAQTATTVQVDGAYPQAAWDSLHEAAEKVAKALYDQVQSLKSQYQY